MKPERDVAQMLAATAIVAAIAIGSAVFTVAGGGIEAEVLASLAEFSVSSLEAQSRSTP